MQASRSTTVSAEPLDGATADTLRAALEAAGYDARTIQEGLGEDGLAGRVPDARQLRRFGEGRLTTLLKLFFYELDVSSADFAATGVPEQLVRAQGDGVVSRIRIEPFDAVVLAGDRWSETPDAEKRPDFVAGMSPWSVELAQLTVREPVARALDVGTGNGVQALLAAQHAERVVATDVNPRALAYAAFNARLNGITNVEFCLGSYFEPVAGERFELVVSNPPFAISPEQRYMFSDSGMRGDAVSRAVLRQAGEHLADGGFAHVVLSWGVGEDEDWRVRLVEWVDGLGCDAWSTLTTLTDAFASATTANQALLGEKTPEYRDAVQRWLDYYDELGFASIALGAVSLRRREDRPTWHRLDDMRERRDAVNAEVLLDVFARQDYLAAVSDDELLDTVLEGAHPHRLEQVRRPKDGDYEVESAVLCLEADLRSRVAVDAFASLVVAACDGSRPVRVVVEEVAERVGVDRESAIARSGPAVRRLFELGFLNPVR